METQEKSEIYYTFNNEIEEYELIDKSHIKNLILERFEKQKTIIEDKYLYSLTLQFIPTRENYHTFNFNKIQEISRKLINGMSSLGSISNRRFWKDNFIGGVRTISIKDFEDGNYPTFSLNFILLSEIDNLDIRLIKQLTYRIRLIDPKISFLFEFIGKYSTDLLCSKIDYKTEVNFNNPLLKKLGETTIDEIFKNQFQRPRFLGHLYKLKKEHS